MLKLSATALGKFFSGCPARHHFYQSYNLVSKPRALQLGELFHQYLEKGIPDDPDEEAADLAMKVFLYLEKQGYEIKHKEWIHSAPLMENVEVHGIVDALAYKDGKPVLIDYKSARSPWQLLKRVEGGTAHVAPQAMTWQGTIYTIPPTNPPKGFSKWPTEIHFIVVPKDGGPIRTHVYQAVPEDIDNLMIAAHMVYEALQRPPIKHRGWACNRCDYKDLCWDIPGWESKFIDRREADEQSDRDEDEE